MRMHRQGGDLECPVIGHIDTHATEEAGYAGDGARFREKIVLAQFMLLSICHRE